MAHLQYRGSRLATQTVIGAGQAARLPAPITDCILKSGPGQATQACLTRLTRLGYRQQVNYQPASRFWGLQRDEAVSYLPLALLLAGLCTWWIRHRLT